MFSSSLSRCAFSPASCAAAAWICWSFTCSRRRSVSIHHAVISSTRSRSLSRVLSPCSCVTYCPILSSVLSSGSCGITSQSQISHRGASLTITVEPYKVPISMYHLLIVRTQRSQSRRMLINSSSTSGNKLPVTWYVAVQIMADHLHLHVRLFIYIKYQCVTRKGNSI